MKSFVFFILILNTITSSTSAYTDTLGIEEGDTVDLEYDLRIQGADEIEETGRFETEVNDFSLIVGFYEGLLGMKIGEDKVIIVPPNKGYTNPTGDLNTDKLIGETLVFNVHIFGIVKNIRSQGSSSDGDLFDKIVQGVKVVGIIALIAFVSIGLYGLRAKTTTPACLHCKSLGRSTNAEGKCSKCGSTYCRASFGRGCPNCKSNSFIPL
jgi:hypothetical protein